MKNKLIIGSRKSKLALTQSNYVAKMIEEAVPGIKVSVEVFSTKGDRILDVPLAKIDGKGLFTKELEVALLEEKIDLAVHSLKDLPTELPEGLDLGAVPERENPLDAFICVTHNSLEDLPEGATIGTSSLRRKAQLLAFRSDLNIADLRGNVDTRVQKVSDGDYDAAILACAGLTRLGKTASITQELSPDIMLPAPGQGALGIEIRDNDSELMELLYPIHDAYAAAEVIAERALLEALGGGCQIPLGTLARVSDDILRLRACVCSLDGRTIVRAECSGDIENAGEIGVEAANILLRDGAFEIIDEALSQSD